jgi:lipopolysaccharide/colanic/teichoic acid biosynthesis glycosyltransferase
MTDSRTSLQDWSVQEAVLDRLSWPRHLAWRRFFVRIWETLLAAVGLAAAAPVLLATLAIVWVRSKQPPLVAHKRVGLFGRDLWVLKIRTMWPANGGPWSHGFIERISTSHVPLSKLEPDSRVTSTFAAFLRQHSIDEWPQLWQVCTGELALIGPRPVTHREFAQHYGASSVRLLWSKPGLVGLWEVRGRNRFTYRQRRRLDFFLIDNWSVRMYVYILFAALGAVISGENAS